MLSADVAPTAYCALCVGSVHAEANDGKALIVLRSLRGGAYRRVPRLGFGLEFIGPVECVLRAPEPGRVRDVHGLECIVVRSLRLKLTELKIA